MNKPAVGEIRKGRYIEGHHNRPYQNFIYRYCVGCGEPNWVRYDNGKASSLRCYGCSAKEVSYRPEIIIARHAIRTNPEYRAKLSAITLASIARPEIKAARHKVQENPEIMAKVGRAAKAMWSKPEFKDRFSVAMHDVWTNPEFRTRRSLALKKALAKPESKAKRRKISIDAWADPEAKARRCAAISATLTSPEYRAAHIGQHAGANSSSWLGGISFEPYTLDFNDKLRTQVRKRDNYTCQLCGKSQNRILLAVHHIDYDKKNNVLGNLISLCGHEKGQSSCHGKTNYNRPYWTTKFQKLLSDKQMVLDKEAGAIG